MEGIVLSQQAAGGDFLRSPDSAGQPRRRVVEQRRDEWPTRVALTDKREQRVFARIPFPVHTRSVFAAPIRWSGAT